LCKYFDSNTTYIILNSSFKIDLKYYKQVFINFISNFFYEIVCCVSDNFGNEFRFFTSIKMEDILQLHSAVILLFIRLNYKITRAQISIFLKTPNTLKIQHSISNSYTTQQISNIPTISIYVLLVQLIYEVRR